MKNQRIITKTVFWSLIAIMLLIVVGITAGTYVQYRMAESVAIDLNETGYIYSVYEKTKGMLFFVGSPF
ncbi:MAG: hypothetical protein JXQ87_07725 [Bacteroidia bacterium]